MTSIVHNIDCMVGIDVLSLFDGMSCAQLAFQRTGIKVNKYYASEVDKHAIKVTQANFPNTIQLGDVTDINIDSLPHIDILCGGSPCQSFSFAGKRKGMSTQCEIEILTLDHYLQLKKEGYLFEGQSYLFWEYMRILTALRKKNPNIKFLLENVMMGEKWEGILTRAIGVNPIEINSTLVSAQNRRRLYWTNIGMVPGGLFGDLESVIHQPKDKKIVLRDILEENVGEKYFLSEKMMNYLNSRAGKYSDVKIDPEKTGAMNTKNNSPQLSTDGGTTLIRDVNGKASCFTAGGNSGGLHSQMDLIVHNTMPRSSSSGKGGTGPLSRNDGKTYCLDTQNKNAIEIKCVAMRGRNPENPTSRESGLQTEQMIEPRSDNKTNCLTSVQKDNLIRFNRPTEISPFQGDKLHYADEKMQCLAAQGGNKLKGIGLSHNSRIRRLTEIECERLQTVPDNYTNHVSSTQRYKMLGNGWTIDVIAHIFSYL